MKVNGEIYTEVDVQTFEFIKTMCQSIGVVDRTGRIVAKLEDEKIVEYYLDIFDITKKRVLYDKPFDVQYASTLMSLYKQFCEYLELPSEVYDKVNSVHGDYRTAYKLEIKKRNYYY